jgi:hypothetical protein
MKFALKIGRVSHPNALGYPIGISVGRQPCAIDNNKLPVPVRIDRPANAVRE